MIMRETLNIFRRDRKNVGDWWSVPARYFPLRAARSFDLADPSSIPDVDGIYVVGGGGLGRPEFVPFLERLTRPDRPYTLVAWGVGSDSRTKRQGAVEPQDDAETLCGYFQGFDLVGTRVWSNRGYALPQFRWVPCASAMHPLIPELARTLPKERIGIYEHLRVPLPAEAGGRRPILGIKWLRPNGFPMMTNRGTNIEEKLRFLARFEFILTNSYHGVFWATLLGRRPICYPFKNGLYSFRYAPAYVGAEGIKTAMEAAEKYPEALDVSRDANLGFYLDLLDRYGDL